MNAKDWATLSVGLAGVLLGAISLTWQAVTFRLTGSRVLAHLRVGVLAASNVITYPVKPDWLKQVQDLQAQHGGTPVLVLEASNVGRLAVGMENADAVTEAAVRVSRAGWHVNPSRGSTLNAGHRATWYVDLEIIQAAVDTTARQLPRYNKPTKVWMELALGSGDQPVRTREALLMHPRTPSQ